MRRLRWDSRRSVDAGFGRTHQPGGLSRSSSACLLLSPGRVHVAVRDTVIVEVVLAAGGAAANTEPLLGLFVVAATVVVVVSTSSSAGPGLAAGRTTAVLVDVDTDGAARAVAAA